MGRSVWAHTGRSHERAPDISHGVIATGAVTQSSQDQTEVETRQSHGRIGRPTPTAFVLNVLCVSKLDFDSAVEDSAFCVRVDFTERRSLMRRKNHWSETALASIGDVLGVDEKTHPAERKSSA